MAKKVRRGSTSSAEMKKTEKSKHKQLGLVEQNGEKSKERERK